MKLPTRRLPSHPALLASEEYLRLCAQEDAAEDAFLKAQQKHEKAVQRRVEYGARVLAKAAKSPT